MPPPSPPTARPALRHYLLLYAAAAAWMDFAGVHRVHRSDTFLFSLASLYHWSPFFWEQDRVGLLVPLLTAWCPDPLAVLLMNTWLTVLLGLAAPLLLAEVVCPRPGGRAAATLANILMLALAPDRVRDNLLFECCYPQGIALGCGGLLVLGGGGDRPRAWRYAAGAGLFVLAEWVYVGAAVWLMPLALWVAVARPGVPVRGLRDAATRLVRYFPGWASLLLLGGAVGLGMWFMQLAREASPGVVKPTPQEGLPREEWPESWEAYLENLHALPGMAGWEAAAGGLAAAGLVVVSIRGVPPGFPLVASLAVLGATGATEFLFVGTRRWPAENGHHLRYVIGALTCAQVILGLAAAAPVAGWAAGRGRWWVFGAGAAGLFAAATAQYGIPAPGRPRAEIDQKFGRFTPQLFDAGADAVGGDYWVVWPAVFHANLAGPPGGTPLYGITNPRSGVFRPQWERTHPGGMRVGVPATDTDRTQFFEAAAKYGLSPPVLIGTRGDLEIYFTRPLPPSAGGP